eukprot:6332760-Prymnesium_polylepis.2
MTSSPRARSGPARGRRVDLLTPLESPARGGSSSVPGFPGEGSKGIKGGARIPENHQAVSRNDGGVHRAVMGLQACE